MRTAGVDAAAVDAGAVGFRLAPRINAAGRLGHPRAALELLLTEDVEEARRLAGELETLNRDRQIVEERIRRDAIAQIEAWPEPWRRRKGYVVASADWHEGVIGIVASRLVERYNRPVVLIAGGDEAWKGSGRSTTSFDLHGALAACSEHLERFGGHRAAAGLSIRPEQVEEFAAAFAAHAEQALGEDDLTPVTRIDAIVPASALTLELAAELERMAPFGLGNPAVTLLASGCELTDLSTVGEGKHLRFRVRQGGRDGGSRDRLRPGRPARPLATDRPLRRRLPPAGEPLERHRRAAARRASGVFDEDERIGGAARPARRAVEGRGTADARGTRRSSPSSSSSRARRRSGACSSPRPSALCSRRKSRRSRTRRDGRSSGARAASRSRGAARAGAARRREPPARSAAGPSSEICFLRRNLRMGQTNSSARRPILLRVRGPNRALH